MQPIVTLTLNPAVDVSSRAAQVVPAHKLRCHDVRHDAGGGGINVARVLHRFGAETRAVFTRGGPVGDLLERLVASEGVPFTAIEVAGDTREDFTVTADDDGAQYRFVLPGPELSAPELDACLGAVSRFAIEGSYVVASGSLPPGAPADAYRRVRDVLPKGASFAAWKLASAVVLIAGIRTHVSATKPSISRNCSTPRLRRSSVPTLRK